MRTTSGEVLKTDAAWHGDDHFSPGPTDVAWDLAGAIVEWRLDDRQRAWLLERYRAASGDDAEPRITAWIFAYAVFHAALASFAGTTIDDEAERARLAAAAARYLAAARTTGRLARTSDVQDETSSAVHGASARGVRARRWPGATRRPLP